MAVLENGSIGKRQYWKTAVLENGSIGKWRYWKTAVKGVILYNQEKNIYSGLENQRWYWGEAANGGAVLGGSTVLSLGKH